MLIEARSICKAFNTFTIYTSQVINKILKKLYYNLIAKYPNLSFSINTIYLDIDIIIHRIKIALKSYSLQTLINIIFFDFEELL
jgi:hypothetical protein